MGATSYDNPLNNGSQRMPSKYRMKAFTQHMRNGNMHVTPDQMMRVSCSNDPYQMQ